MSTAQETAFSRITGTIGGILVMATIFGFFAWYYGVFDQLTGRTAKRKMTATVYNAWVNQVVALSEDEMTVFNLRKEPNGKEKALAILTNRRTELSQLNPLHEVGIDSGLASSILEYRTLALDKTKYLIRRTESIWWLEQNELDAVNRKLAQATEKVQLEMNRVGSELGQMQPSPQKQSR